MKYSASHTLFNEMITNEIADKMAEEVNEKILEELENE